MVGQYKDRLGAFSLKDLTLFEYQDFIVSLPQRKMDSGMARDATLTDRWYCQQ